MFDLNDLVEYARKKVIKRKDRYHHVAVLFEPKGKIYIGENKPVSWCKHLSIHAEIDVLKKIEDKNKKHYLLVLRLSSTGKLCESKPCYHCIQKLKQTKISKIFYSRCDESIVCEKIHSITNRKSSGYRKNDK